MQENLANPLGPSFQILLLLGFVVVGVLFILTQQNTLKLIQPMNRMIRPGQVWLQLIPIFGLLYQFTVVTRIARSRSAGHQRKMAYLFHRHCLLLAQYYFYCDEMAPWYFCRGEWICFACSGRFADRLLGKGGGF